MSSERGNQSINKSVNFYSGLSGAAAARTTSWIRYDTRCYFNVRSKADISQLNLPHGTMEVAMVEAVLVSRYGRIQRS